MFKISKLLHIKIKISSIASLYVLKSNFSMMKTIPIHYKLLLFIFCLCLNSSNENNASYLEISFV